LALAPGPGSEDGEIDLDDDHAEPLAARDRLGHDTVGERPDLGLVAAPAEDSQLEDLARRGDGRCAGRPRDLLALGDEDLGRVDPPGEQLTPGQKAQRAAMAAFGADGRCLMRVLQEELDDPDAGDCGRCAACTAPRFAAPPDPRLVELAARHPRSRPIELDQKKMAPDAAGTMRKIPDEVRVEPGWALARFGDGGWWPAVERGLRSGEFDEEVVLALAGHPARQPAPARMGHLRPL